MLWIRTLLTKDASIHLICFDLFQCKFFSELRYDSLCKQIIRDMNMYGMCVVDDFLGMANGLSILNEGKHWIFIAIEHVFITQKRDKQNVYMNCCLCSCVWCKLRIGWLIFIYLFSSWVVRSGHISSEYYKFDSFSLFLNFMIGL